MNTAPAGNDASVSAAPLLVGPENCAAVLGRDWRWCRDQAARLGCLFHVGRKAVIDAAAFLQALRARALTAPAPELPAQAEGRPPEPADVDAVDPARAVEIARRMLGVRRRAG